MSAPRANPTDLLADLARVIVRDPSPEALCEALYELCLRFVEPLGFAVILREDEEPSVLFERGEPLKDRYVSFTMFAEGKPVGRVLLRAKRPITPRAAKIIETASLYVGASLANRQLAEVAIRDPLTGLSNRRAFDQALRRAFRRCAQSLKHISLLLLDVDFFHAFNERYGHLAGDMCLQEIARALGDCATRRFDLAARYGGEEFVILLPDCEPEGARRVAQAALDAVASLRLEHAGSTLERVSISIGVASADPAAGVVPRDLIAAADALLYRAKSSGRNRFVDEKGVEASTPAYERFETLHNFPSYISSFVGRERDLHEVHAALRGARLVSIIGSAGIGKTRLAVHAGLDIAERFRDGARLIALAAKRKESEIISALAHAFEVREAHSGDVFGGILHELRDRRALVIFDTCEHVLRACAGTVQRLLAECPQICVIATSREALNIPGEIVYRLGAMDANDARDLFAQRANIPVERTGEHGLSRIAEICTHLECVPLALELVAAQASQMSLEQIALAVRRPNDTLKFTLPGQSGRQQSLYRAIEWSYDLLSKEQQRLFAQLSLFAFGGMTHAVRAICRSEDLPAPAIDGLLEDLDRKSLIELDRDKGDFRLREPVAHYARTRLNVQKRDELGGRFGRYYAEQSERLLLGGDAPYQAAVAASPVELDNYALALMRLIERKSDIERAGSLTANLCGYLGRLGRYGEARRWSSLALKFKDEYGDAILSRIYHALSVAAYGQADARGAERFSRKALAAYERLGDEVGTARALQTIGSSYYIRGRYAHARRIYRRCLQVYRRVGNEHATAAVLANLAAVEDDGYCNWAGALEAIGEAIALCRRIDPGFKLGACLLTLGHVRYCAGTDDAALEALVESLEILDRLGHPFAAMTLSIAARCHVRRGNQDEARVMLRKAARTYAGAEAPHYAAYCIESFALLAAAVKQYETAAYLLAFSDAYRERNGDQRANADRADYDSTIASAANALGEAAFKRCAERARAATLTSALRQSVLV